MEFNSDISNNCGDDDEFSSDISNNSGDDDGYNDNDDDNDNENSKDINIHRYKAIDKSFHDLPITYLF